MIPLLFGFVKGINPRTWLLIGLAAAVVYAGGRLYSLGIEHERTKARAEVLEADQQQAKQERDQFEEKMHEAEQLAASAVQAQHQAMEHIAVLDQRLARANQAQAAASSQLAALPDSQLFADIRARLARHAGDSSPSFYPDELREIDSNLVEQPYLEDRLSILSDKVQALSDKSDAQARQLAAASAETAALASYAAALHEHYRTAYNLAQPRVPLIVKIFTLGLKKQKKLTLPAPEAIPVPTPAA